MHHSIKTDRLYLSSCRKCSGWCEWTVVLRASWMCNFSRRAKRTPRIPYPGITVLVHYPFKSLSVFLCVTDCVPTPVLSGHRGVCHMAVFVFFHIAYMVVMFQMRNLYIQPRSHRLLVEHINKPQTWCFGHTFGNVAQSFYCTLLGSELL